MATNPEPRSSALAERDWPYSWQAPFLEAFSRTGNVSAACRHAGITRTYVYEVAKADSDFAAAWDEAKEVGVDLLEQVAHRRATVGDERRVVRTTRKIAPDGTLIEETVVVEESVVISNAILTLLLKANRPEVYRERHEHRVTGPGGGPVQYEVYRWPTPERAQRLLELRAAEAQVIDAEAEELP